MKKFNINIRFGRKAIVKGRFSVGDHGIFLLKGPVGSGKTSILRQIYFRAFHRQAYSYSTLDFPFEAKIKVVEHIDNVRNATNLDSEKLEKLLLKFNIYNLLDNDVERLSDGEKSRLLICLSLAQISKIVLLDEPSSRLDQINIDRLLEIISEEKDQRTFIIATHRSDFDVISSGTIAIVNGDIHSNFDLEIDHGIKKNMTRRRAKRTPPCSRVHRFLTRAVSCAFLMITAASFVPIIEYLAPSEDNFYRGPKEGLPFQFEQLDKNWNDDLLEGVTSFDFYSTPGAFDYSSQGRPFRFNILDFLPSRNFLFLEYGEYPLSNPFFECIHEGDFGISRDLFRLFQSRHPKIDYTDIEIGGLFCRRLIDNPGLFIEYPEKYIQNINRLKARYLTPDDKIYDKNSKLIELQSHEIAISYEKYLNNPSILGTFIDGREVVGYSPFSSVDVINSKYDFHADQINIFKGGGNIYSRTNILPPGFEKYYEVVDDYELSKSRYRKYLVDNCMLIPLLFGSTSFVMSLLFFAISFALEDIKKGAERELYLFYNKPSFTAIRSLTGFDLLPSVLTFLSTLLMTPLIIRALWPTLNILPAIGICCLLVLIFTILCTVINMLINMIRQRKLR